MSELERRILDLQAVAGEHLPGGGETERFAWLVCDGCGVRVDLGDPPDLTLVEGWMRAGGMDFCEGCS